ncbi:MAG: NAD-dependent epimerase/dehydratase family protein [Halobacteriovoraceae bacterium]|nr:NAD-dependent epimerase/dehydratase family protein [Halobacteriovoraceae bacterium]MCB9093545.1 NAD-dependent epimerase/dehydratase family protein [Halobacteriovoraceae bacterium]
MKILITGAGGFLGKKICEFLSIEKQFQLLGINRKIYPELYKIGVEQFAVDLRNIEELEKVFSENKIEAVIHTAAKAGIWGEFEDYYSINFKGTINLLTLCHKYGVKYFVYTSTPSVVFGRKAIRGASEKVPYASAFLTAYAKTKSLAEKEVLNWNTETLKTLAIRPHLIWGPGDPHILPRLVDKAKSGKLKIVGDGENLVDIIYVDNAAWAHIQALKKLISGELAGGSSYFIGQERPVKLWSFINQLLKTQNVDPIEKSLSSRFCYLLGLVLEKVFKWFKLKNEPPMTRFVALQLSKDHYFSHQKAKQDFDYQVRVKIEEGLERLSATH